MTEQDVSYVHSSFLKSYHQHSIMKFVPNTIYYKNQEEIIHYLTKNANTLIACFPEDPEEIMGYIIYEIVSDMLVLHWIQVKGIHMHMQLATKIINSICPKDNCSIIATHITFDYERLKTKIDNKKFSYDPFYIVNKRLNGHSR